MVRVSKPWYKLFREAVMFFICISLEIWKSDLDMVLSSLSPVKMALLEQRSSPEVSSNLNHFVKWVTFTWAACLNEYIFYPLQLGPWSTKNTLSSWSMLREGQQSRWGIWSISLVRSGWGKCDYLVWRRWSSGEALSLSTTVCREIVTRWGSVSSPT